MRDVNSDGERVECGFGCTPAVKHLLTAMVVIPFFVLITLFCSLVDITTVGGAISYLSCIAVILGALTIYLRLGKGKITADEKSVDVHYGFLSRSIPLSEIENVRCEVETQGTRYGDVIYTLFLLIETKDEKSYRYELELPIEKDYPVKYPEEYRRYLHNQPMMRLYDYINKRV